MDSSRPELVFALTAPLGTRLEELGERLAEELGGFGYTPVQVRVSSLLSQFPDWKDQPDRFEAGRLAHYQKVANDIRRRTEDGAVLARAAISQIREERRAKTGSADKPANNCAFIISQLKHPDEVQLLRDVYGPALYVVAGHASRDVRNRDLAHKLANSADQPGQDNQFIGPASVLIEEDQKSADAFGQNMRDTYPQADVFIDLNTPNGEYAVHRFVDLLFGHPMHTPTPEEFAMYQASAVALRSADVSRQVGAAIVRVAEEGGSVHNADVLAVGMNEVPRGGGGYYWDKASPDHRDQAMTEDRATNIKISALSELIEQMRGKSWLGQEIGNSDSNELARQLLPNLKKTQFMAIGEFSRPVHAEMAALIDAARRGVSIDGHCMFVTTFPCHNCAKHIIAAGLRRVVYLEPYPKSRAGNLYAEEVVLDSKDGKAQAGKLIFSAYTGVAPRQYRTLFSMLERGAKQGLTRAQWQQRKNSAAPHYVHPHMAAAYVIAEAEARAALDKYGYKGP